MPPSDICEPQVTQVIRAIEKAGFRLTHKQFAIRPTPEESFVYADLRFQHDNQVIIVVEVKCFPFRSAFTEEFYQAVGQYLLYRNSLRLAGIEGELYLAVPFPIYVDYISERASARATLTDASIKLIVVDLVSEEIIEWKTW